MRIFYEHASFSSFANAGIHTRDTQLKISATHETYEFGRIAIKQLSIVYLAFHLKLI